MVSSNLLTVKYFLGTNNEALYLTWNERHLRAYIEKLMTLLQTSRFLLLLKYVNLMTATTNAEN